MLFNNLNNELYLEVDDGIGGGGNGNNSNGIGSNTGKYIINIQSPVGYTVFINDSSTSKVIPTILEFEPPQLLNGVILSSRLGSVISPETYTLKTNLVNPTTNGGTDDFGNPIGPNSPIIQ